MKKTNSIMNEIRRTITPEIKIQMELSVAIANRIYSAMEERGMSQKELAKIMGKTETEVSRWLSGTHNLTLSTIAKISAALGEDIIRTTPLHVTGYSATNTSTKCYLSDVQSPSDKHKQKQSSGD